MKRYTEYLLKDKMAVLLIGKAGLGGIMKLFFRK